MSRWAEITMRGLALPMHSTTGDEALLGDTGDRQIAVLILKAKLQASGGDAQAAVASLRTAAAQTTGVKLRHAIGSSALAIARSFIMSGPADTPIEPRIDLEAARIAVNMLPSNVSAWRCYASMLDQADRLPEALAAYDHALALDPVHADWHVGRGNILRRMGRNEEANAAFAEAVALDEDSVVSTTRNEDARPDPEFLAPSANIGISDDPPVRLESSGRYDILGIDLGTTNSCIATVDEIGRPLIIPNAVGERTTPSVIYFESRGRVTIGRKAVHSGVLDPARILRLPKHLMGDNSATYRYEGVDYNPESVAAIILRQLVLAASAQSGVAARHIVIAVPASFGLAERFAIKRAGESTGATVEVVPEPLAAALNYRYQTGADDSVTRNVLVYDLGGGAFDASVIRVDGENVSMISTAGDHLGGRDWDDAVARYMLERFVDEHPELDPSDDPSFMRQLLNLAEFVKRQLCFVESQHCSLRFAGVEVGIDIDRSLFERLTASLLRTTITLVEMAMTAARELGTQSVDEILMIGGMTRMPAVASALQDCFGLTAIAFDPDVAVAQGAALFAARNAHAIRQVVARSLGVMVVADEGIFQREPTIVHVLKANTPLPAEAEALFAVASDGQSVINLEIWEQASSMESENINDNRIMGQVLIALPPGTLAGSPIRVVFKMSESGELNLKAVASDSGREGNIRVNVVQENDFAAMIRLEQDESGFMI